MTDPASDPLTCASYPDRFIDATPGREAVARELDVELALCTGLWTGCFLPWPTVPACRRTEQTQVCGWSATVALAGATHAANGKWARPGLHNPKD